MQKKNDSLIILHEITKAPSDNSIYDENEHPQEEEAGKKINYKSISE